MKQLILGGARSGKSALAERIASHTGNTVVYIATADRSRNDQEMTDRIDRHRQSRPAHWRTVEASVELAATLREHDADDCCLLVDCLTLWLSNCLFERGEDAWQQQREALLNTLPGLHGDVILIGNELGSGVVPMGAATRQFVDENGFLHQALANHCDRVILTAAGLPLVLKGPALEGNFL